MIRCPNCNFELYKPVKKDNKMIIAGIDPGPITSGLCIWDTNKQKILFHHKEFLNDNIEMGEISYNDGAISTSNYTHIDVYIIEDIKSYGMAVGESVFATCKQIGRLQERLIGVVTAYKRDIQLHFCNTTKAKDKNIKRVLLDRFGEKGTKKNPGTTYGLSDHAWDAFALCIFHQDNKEG